MTRRRPCAPDVWLPLLLMVLAAPGAGEIDPIPELLELYHQRDYFELRARLPEATASDSAERRFLRAAVHHAFNRPLESNRALLDLSLGLSDLPASLRSEALRLQMENHLLLHDYASALASARSLVRAPGEHPADLVAEVANTALLIEALESVPPQTVDVRSTTRLKLELRRRLVAVEVDGSRVELAIDTGANYSALMRSVAQRAGLAIRPVGLKVATSTGSMVEADVAVAERVSLGRVEFRNVVFLVFPDELLSFADGSRLAGLVGFPMLEAVGEIRLLRDNVLEIPARAPKRNDSNLALDGLDLLVSARFQKDEVVCRLDTGSDRTFFYAPFFRRFRSRIERLGAPEQVEVEGVGGGRAREAIRIASLTLAVARADLLLREPLVYTAPLIEGGTETLSCNLGVDQFDRFRYYAINFEDMALVLGPVVGSPRR